MRAYKSKLLFLIITSLCYQLFVLSGKRNGRIITKIKGQGIQCSFANHASKTSFASMVSRIWGKYVCIWLYS